jgi:hypothetical protein
MYYDRDRDRVTVTRLVVTVTVTVTNEGICAIFWLRKHRLMPDLSIRN